MVKQKIGIQNFLVRHMVLTAAISFCLVLFIWISNEYAFFLTKSKLLREEYLTSQKGMLKSEVNNVVEYINYMKSQIEINLKSELRGRVYEAVAIAENIYRENVGAKPIDDIKKMIKDALRPIRFLNGRGYYFAFSMDGIETLFSDRPEMEGVNMLPVQGAKGEYVVKDMIEMVQNQREGFYQYTWTKPSQQGKDFLKIAFVKYFKPLDWSIGTGEYLKDFTEQIQDLVLKRIVSLRFGDEGYFFGSMEDGYPLFTNGKITRGGARIWDIEDAAGEKIIQKQQKVSKTSQGGFVEYVWHKLGAKNPSPKISYVRSIPGWGWTIGAGVYVDTVEEIIAKNEAVLKRELIKKVAASTAVLTILIVLLWFWAKYVGGKTRKSIKTFESFFNRATSESVTIPTGEMPFRELSRIADSANHMIKTQKQTEKALRESEEKFRLISEQSLLAIGILQDGYVKYANEMYSTMTGYSLEEINHWEPYGYAITIHHDDLPFVMAQAEKKQAGETDVSTHYRFRGVTKDKNMTWWDLYSKTIAYHGKPADLFAIIDITEREKSEAERKALQKQLQHAQKMEAIGTLAGGVAHDFNNLLTGIQGRASLVLMDKDASHPDFEHLTAIEAHVRSAAGLTRQLLGFARGGKYEVKPTDLNALIQKETEMFGRTRKELSIHEKYENELWTVSVDRGQMAQVFLNLYVNAWQAMGAGGELRIETQNVTLHEDKTEPHDVKPGRYVQIAVSDTGVGMNKATLEKIFDPFFTTKEMGRGTGLGLASVYGIVKNHGGFIDVDSKEGHGSTFTICLPASHEVVIKDKMSPVELLRGSETVLFVDDEEILTEFAEDLLSRLGYTVLIAKSGKEAVRIYDDNRESIDIVLLDMIMPNMGGGETYEHLKRMDSKVKVLLSSGYSIDGQATAILNRGCNGFIQKPFNIQTLSEKLREILDAKPECL